MSERRLPKVIYVSGPVVKVSPSTGLSMNEMVEIGPERLVGEVIELLEEVATVQVYEDTTGLTPGTPVEGKGLPLYVELGPGLVGHIFDGLQRPLRELYQEKGPFIQRGKEKEALSRERVWKFKPLLSPGAVVAGGEIFGEVEETSALKHYLLIPPEISGKLVELAPPGQYTLADRIGLVVDHRGREHEIFLYSRWPVRRPRPVKKRLVPEGLLISGQRVLDFFFPLAKGGTAAIPGGFGTGKTILQHQLAKWADADLIIYIGCGERGNEMTDVLHDFPRLVDPRTQKPLIERTILIANTSDMPVAAREASIYTGLTLAEYYRDMGYHVAIMADSTSRWAEALREIAGRLEEMPAEEGYPAYLASRLAEFYERAGLAETLSGKKGSVSIIGAVSPPGGDFSEPVTQHTKRFVQAFWMLDKELASARHFPAINYLTSYSGYAETAQKWWQKEGFEDFSSLREEALSILKKDAQLQNIVKLIGEETLPDDQRLFLAAARIIKEDFLQQNAFDPVDTFCPLAKQYFMMSLILHLVSWLKEAVGKRLPLEKALSLPVLNRIHQMKYNPMDQEVYEELKKEIDQQFKELFQEEGLL